MMWPFKKEQSQPSTPYGYPEGTSMSDWERYTFTPRTDITAYELAVIIKEMILPSLGVPCVDPNLVLLAKVRPPDNPAYAPEIVRHFTKIDEDAKGQRNEA